MINDSLPCNIYQTQIPVTVDGRNYEIKFNVGKDTILDTAARFCKANSNDFGVTAETITNCIDPIAAYLQRSIESEISQIYNSLTSTSSSESSAVKRDSIVVSMVVEGITYDITLRPDIASASNAATVFCREKASEIGVTEATFPNCVNSVSEYLQRAILKLSDASLATPAAETAAVNSEQSDGMLTTPLRMSGVSYNIRFKPEPSSIASIATRFCQEQGLAAGVTAQTMPSCINAVTQYLQQVADRAKAASDASAVTPSRNVATGLETGGGLRVTLNIANKDYDIIYQPSINADVTARAFCLREGGSFGITQDNLSECVEPVAKYLIEAYVRSQKGSDTTTQNQQAQEQRRNDESVPAKTAASALRVTVMIADKNYDILFQPNVSAEEQAQAFCAKEGSAFGVTAQNMVDCINPVAAHLMEAYRKSISEQQAKANTQRPSVVKLVVNINDREFNVMHPLGSTAQATATSFCTTESSQLGLTADSMAACVESLTSFILKSLERLEDMDTPVQAQMLVPPTAPRTTTTSSGINAAVTPLEQTSGLRVTLNIANKDYDIIYQPSIGADVTARTFCLREGGAFGITRDNLSDCVEPVAKYIIEAYVRSQKERNASVQSDAPPAPPKSSPAGALNIRLQISGTEYDVVHRTDVSVEVTSEDFCRRHSATLGITEATLANCVSSLSKYIAQVSSSTKSA